MREVFVVVLTFVADKSICSTPFCNNTIGARVRGATGSGASKISAG